MNGCDTRPSMFEFDGEPVRITYGSDGEPLWVHNDVCACLAISDKPQAASRLDDDEKGWVDLPTPSGTQRIRVINEAGLYTLILRSKTPAAKRFKRWVTHEVLPQIRKTGSYSMAPKPPVELDLVNNPEAALAMLTKVSAMALEELRARKAAEAKVAELEPKAEAWAAMVDTDKDHSVADAAKLLSRAGDIEIGEVRLFKWLVDGGHIFDAKDQRGRRYYSPYQKHITAGRLAVKLGKPWWNSREDKLESGNPQIRIPASALDYWLEKLRADGRFAVRRAQLALVTT